MYIYGLMLGKNLKSAFCIEDYLVLSISWIAEGPGDGLFVLAAVYKKAHLAVL